MGSHDSRRSRSITGYRESASGASHSLSGLEKRFCTPTNPTDARNSYSLQKLPQGVGVLNIVEGGEHLEGSTIRVLVVDDYEPFRQFVCKTLGERQDTQVIGEASDGLDAIRKAEELQPDLIVLDIGLPALNGIEAGRRIRKLCPDCKILFLSQESSVEVAQETFELGASAYVVKSTCRKRTVSGSGSGLPGQAVRQ